MKLNELLEQIINETGKSIEKNKLLSLAYLCDLEYFRKHRVRIIEDYDFIYEPNSLIGLDIRKRESE